MESVMCTITKQRQLSVISIRFPGGVLFFDSQTKNACKVHLAMKSNCQNRRFCSWIYVLYASNFAITTQSPGTAISLEVCGLWYYRFNLVTIYPFTPKATFNMWEKITLNLQNVLKMTKGNMQLCGKLVHEVTILKKLRGGTG
jgi:hypothetical protein